MPQVVHAAIAAILRPAETGPIAGKSSVADRYAILLTRRRPETVYAGYWELPGGKIENDETPEQAVVREVREEIGCDVLPTGVLDPIEHTYDHAQVVLHTVLCSITPDSPEPRPIEVDDLAWRRLSDLPWEAFLPANVRIVTALCRWLEGSEGAPTG